MTSQAPSDAAQLALGRGGDDADAVRAGEPAELDREHAEPAGGAPDQHPVAGLDPRLVDQHPVGREVGQAVARRLLPRQRGGLRQALLGLDLAELGERPPGGLVAPDPLGRRRERVEPVDLDVLVGGLVAVQDDLVARLPARDALADLPDDAGRVRAADVVVLVVVAEDRHRLAERGPDVVEVDAGRHHAHHDLEGAGLGYRQLLELEGVQRLALALLADHPGGHRGGQLARLDVQLRDSACVDGHGADRRPAASMPRRSEEEREQMTRKLVAAVLGCAAIVAIAAPAAEAARCDPIGGGACLLPFPNDFFTQRDAATPTGRRLALDRSVMPANSRRRADRPARLEPRRRLQPRPADHRPDPRPRHAARVRPHRAGPDHRHPGRASASAPRPC